MSCRARHLRFALFVSSLALCPSTGTAQGFGNMVPGEARIRVQVAAPESLEVITPGATVKEKSREVTGTFQAVHGRSIVIRDRKMVDWMIPISAVTKLEISEGRRSHAGRGALIGLLSGGAGGVAAGLIVCANGNCETSGLDNETEIVAFVLGVGGAFAGAGFGAMVGALIHTEKWEEKPSDPIHLGLSPSREGGVRLALTRRLP